MNLGTPARRKSYLLHADTKEEAIELCKTKAAIDGNLAYAQKGVEAYRA